MDEVDIIQTHLLSRAGEHTDVILGLGYDNNLGAALGITLIATGFEHKDPFVAKSNEPGIQPKKEEKVLMALSIPEDEHPFEKRPVLSSEIPASPAATLVAAAPPAVAGGAIRSATAPVVIHPAPSHHVPVMSHASPVREAAVMEAAVMEKAAIEKAVIEKENPLRIEWVLSPEPEPVPQAKKQASPAAKSSPASAASGGYLARPANIYEDDPWSEKQSHPTAAEGSPKAVPEHNPTLKEPILNTAAADPVKEEMPSAEMQLVFRETDPTADEPGAHQTHTLSVPNSPVEEPATQDDADDLKRRAADRINKLRNLSFNVNAADPNNEFETVPAYIRRNLELYNTISSVENFYSNYEVKTDENNNTEISTINTFLDGKRPD
jgi:cell division protein FtsZ